MRELYHGILQIGVGLHHWRRGNYHGATVLLEEGLLRLQPFAPRCHGVDVGALIAEAGAARARLLALGAERMGEVDPGRSVRIRGWDRDVRRHREGGGAGAEPLR